MRLRLLTVSIVCFLLGSFAMASSLPTAEVIKLRGEVLFNNHVLKLGEIIKSNGNLSTKDHSYVQLKIQMWQNNISLGPASTMELNFDSDKNYTLNEGVGRWKSFGKSESKGKIYTNTVSMGVRGTDFWLKKNSLLDESEIIMFDGEVDMSNLQNSKNSVRIKKGQWGGLGGRYGKAIAPPLTLPAAVLEITEKSLE